MIFEFGVFINFFFCAKINYHAGIKSRFMPFLLLQPHKTFNDLEKLILHNWDSLVGLLKLRTGSKS